MHTEDIEYSSNGLRLVGELAVDESRDGQRPALLVAHEGGGLTDHAKDSARRLAFEEEMRAGGVDWRLNLYGGAVHSFTNPAVDAMQNPALAYHPTADACSWRAMLDLFTETFE